MSLRLPDSGAETDGTGRRHAPSAARNAAPLADLLRDVLPASGRLLELASGTGQHAAALSAALPGWIWQPSEINPALFPSIRAWAQDAPRILPPIGLDAAQLGWAAPLGQWDAVLLVNLLHLIPQRAASTVLEGMAAALAPAGRAVIYGPFLRQGKTTSPGDAAFHADLQEQDPAIGYKELDWVSDRLAAAGLTLRCHTMPANNLALVATRG